MSESIEIKIRDAYKHNKYSKCVELIEMLPASVNETSQYKILKASCLNNISGRTSEALALLDAVIKSDPQNPLALFGRGLVCINEGNCSEAVKCFSQAIELEPGEKMEKARAMKLRAEKMLMTMKAKKRISSKLDLSSCKVCGKVFTKNFSLMRHMLLHTGERPFKCPTCSFGFIQKSDLLRHEATHRAQFNLHCSMCTKRFKTKKNLQTHLNMHSKDRPFPCPHCSKSFKLPRLLDFHIATHRNVKELQCDLCGKNFTKQPYIAVHMKTCHLRNEATVTLEPVQIKAEPNFSQDIIHEKPIDIKAEPMETSNISFEEEVSDGSAEIRTFGNVAYVPLADPDMEFFRSLVRDVGRMNEQQKEQFQRKTRVIIKEMLN